MTTEHKPHSMDDAVETLRRFIDHTDFYGPTKKAVDAHEALTSLVEQYEGVKREIEVLRQTCAISFSGKDAGIATLIRRAESAEEQLEAGIAVVDLLLSQMSRGTSGVRDESWYAARDVAENWLPRRTSSPATSPKGNDLWAAWNRCPICEGVDQPGLIHNPEAPYCSQASVPAIRPCHICGTTTGEHELYCSVAPSPARVPRDGCRTCHANWEECEC